MTDEAENLKVRIDELTPMGVRFVGRMVDSLQRPAAPTPSTASTWLTLNPEWVEYFSLVISAHHGVTTEPLGLVNFEVAFRNACEAVGWTVSPPGSATQRFVDLEVDDGTQARRLSLKSTAAKSLSPSRIHISKLTEAAWIQDMRSAATRREKTIALFREYRATVDSIVMLRAFMKKAGQVPTRYELVEIPTTIFASLDNEPVASFDSDGPRIACSLDGEPVVAHVALDRSDAKITVASIKITACEVHARWDLTPADAPIAGPAK